MIERKVRKVVKGYICFKDKEIPFVINNYVLELFYNDEATIADFCKEYNRKKNYILIGKIYEPGGNYRKSECLVEYSLGTICYLTCYTLSNSPLNIEYDRIVFESDQLDSIFRYKYNYLDLSRKGVNFSSEAKTMHEITFLMDSKNYELKYIIGNDFKMGLLEKFEMIGRTVVDLNDCTICECSKLIRLMHRLLIFMVNPGEVCFTNIKLLKDNHLVGFVYCNLLKEEHTWANDIKFYEFDVDAFLPRIVQNLALDINQKITRSVPLGHLIENSIPYKPNKFIEMINSFEYLFEKLEPEKARKKEYTLKKEMEEMFNAFPFILSDNIYSSSKVSKELKELRINIVHGYEYYYEIEDSKNQFCVMKLEWLLRAMSLRLMNFSDEEINKAIF